MLHNFIFIFLSLPAYASDIDSNPIKYIVSKDAAQGISVSIVNNHTYPVTALLIETRQFSNNRRLKAVHVKYQDVLVNLNHDQPLPPGSTRVVPLLAPPAIEDDNFEVRVAAALFQDGTRFGNELDLGVLTGRRLRLKEQLASIMGLLQRAGHDRGALSRDIDEQLAAVRAFKGNTRTEYVIESIATLPLTFTRNELAARDANCSSISCRDANNAAILRRLALWHSWLDKEIR